MKRAQKPQHLHEYQDPRFPCRTLYCHKMLNGTYLQSLVLFMHCAFHLSDKDYRESYWKLDCDYFCYQSIYWLFLLINLCSRCQDCWDAANICAEITFTINKLKIVAMGSPVAQLVEHTTRCCSPGYEPDMWPFSTCHPSLILFPDNKAMTR